jgi:hypothetical protein
MMIVIHLGSKLENCKLLQHVLDFFLQDLSVAAQLTVFRFQFLDALFQSGHFISGRFVVAGNGQQRRGSAAQTLIFLAQAIDQLHDSLNFLL